MKKIQDQESQPILGNSNHSDWESFKTKYYQMENQIQTTLETLSKTHGDTCKKLAIFDEAESESLLNDHDEAENKRKFQQIDLTKVQNMINSAQEMMDQMKQILSEIQIDPDESQLKLKQNILKRFKEIHIEHEKELIKIKNSFDYNMKKYDLFKESFTKQKGLASSTKYNNDEIAFNRQLNKSINQTDAVIDMARNIHNNFIGQGLRLNRIQSKVSEILGSFVDIDNLIRNIRRRKIGNQIIVMAIIAFLLIFILYKMFLS